MWRGEERFNSQTRLDGGEAPRDVRTDPVRRLRLAADRLDRIGDVGDQITGEHAGLSKLLSGKVARCSMKIRCGAGRFPCLESLGKQANDHHHPQRLSDPAQDGSASETVASGADHSGGATILRATHLCVKGDIPIQLLKRSETPSALMVA